VLFGRIRRRAKWKAAIFADARRLIDTFHEWAYFEARDRVRGRCVNRAHPARYRTAIKPEVARQQRIAIDLAGASMRG
jgi:hypothetical protein